MQLRLAEIRPERRRDDKLRVRNLPEEEIAHAHLAARADEQIGIGKTSRVEMLRDDLLVDVSGVELASFHIGGDAAHGIYDLSTATVAQCEDEREAVVLGERGAGLLELLLHILW